MALIEHFPFIGINNNDIVKEENQITLNISLTIITSFTDKNKAKLVDQLNRNKINYINATENITDFKKAFKPIYYNEVIKDVTTDYILIIDSYDTIIYGFDDMPLYLNNYNKDMIYSAWKIHFPTFIDFDFSVPKENNLKYLNSGVFFGKTDFVKNFYNDLSNFIKMSYSICNNWLKNYEQYWIYKYISEHKEFVNNLGIDYDELIVKNMR